MELIVFGSVIVVMCQAVGWQSLLKNTDLSTLYFGPVVYNESLFGPYGTSSAATSAWEISQWLNPFPFLGGPTAIVPPNPSCSSEGLAGVWSIENPSMRVCLSTAKTSTRIWKAGESVIQLAQDGTHLECGNEFDLFLSPIDAAYPRYRQNVERRSLAELESLQLNVSFELVYTATSQRCEKSPKQCGPSGEVDYSYITIGIPLSNNYTDQTIFYQINMFDTRSSFCPTIDPCTPTGPYWYFTTLPQLGVNYNIADFAGQRCLLQAGDVSRVSIGKDLLDTLKHSVAFANQTFGSDGNMSHWFTGSLYVGSGMQGNADITTNIGGISFEGLML